MEESEVTTKLGPQLSLVKQELKSVAATIPDHVEEWITVDNWRHWRDRFANRSNNTYAPISWKAIRKVIEYAWMIQTLCRSMLRGC